MSGTDFLTSVARFFVKIYFHKKCGVFEARKKAIGFFACSDAAYAASEHEKGAARLLLKSYVMLLAFYQKKLVIWP